MKGCPISTPIPTVIKLLKENKLDEAAMTALIEALPTAQQSNAKVLLYDNSDSNELNKLTDAHIAAAKDKGYMVMIKESDASGWETK